MVDQTIINRLCALFSTLIFIAQFTPSYVFLPFTPMASASKVIPSRKKPLFAYKRELLAIAFVVQQWRSYLWGRKFIIKTNHLPLKHLFEQRDLNQDQFLWLHKLWGFHYEIVYRNTTKYDLLTGVFCLFQVFLS